MSTTPKIFIPIYHSVDDISYPYAVRIKAFDAHIKYIAENYEALTFEKFEQVVKGEYIPKKDAVLVTFDDGVEDNYLQAFPILKKYNVPAVIFFATDLEGRLHTGPQGFSFQFMNWEQAKEMVDSGLVSIQSHTHTHPLLPNVTEEDMAKEMSISNALIKEKLGYDVHSIAYPKGEYSEEVIAVAKKYYSLAFAGWGGYNVLPVANAYTISRMMVSQDTSLLKFMLMFRPFPWKIRTLLRKFVRIAR